MTEIIDLNKVLKSKADAKFQALARKNYLEISKNPWPIINSLQKRGDRYRELLYKIGILCKDNNLAPYDKLGTILFLLEKEKIVRGPVA